MNAQKALENKRFASEEADIASARKTAANNVAAMTAGFKVQLLAASTKIREQVTKVNDRIDKTAGVVRSDAARQAKRNAHINNALAAVRKTLKADRKHAHDSLKKQTGKLF